VKGHAAVSAAATGREKVAGKLTNRAEVIAFVGAYMAGDRIIALTSANLLPWLIENGHEDKITLAGWAISLAVMVVVLPTFLVLRRWLGGQSHDHETDYP
jgi:hypothetical protein